MTNHALRSRVNHFSLLRPNAISQEFLQEKTGLSEILANETKLSLMRWYSEMQCGHVPPPPLPSGQRSARCSSARTESPHQTDKPSPRGTCRLALYNCCAYAHMGFRTSLPVERGSVKGRFGVLNIGIVPEEYNASSARYAGEHPDHSGASSPSTSPQSSSKQSLQMLRKHHG
jgi:hypothetical protein